MKRPLSLTPYITYYHQCTFVTSLFTPFSISLTSILYSTGQNTDPAELHSWLPSTFRSSLFLSYLLISYLVMWEFLFSSHSSSVSPAGIGEETLLKAFWIFKDKTAEPSWSVTTEYINQNTELFFKNWDHFTYNSPSHDQLCCVCYCLLSWQKTVILIQLW